MRANASINDGNVGRQNARVRRKHVIPVDLDRHAQIALTQNRVQLIANPANASGMHADLQIFGAADFSDGLPGRLGDKPAHVKFPQHPPYDIEGQTDNLGVQPGEIAIHLDRRLAHQTRGIRVALRLAVFIALRIFSRVGPPSGLAHLPRITPGFVEKGISIQPRACFGRAQNAGARALGNTIDRVVRFDHLV